MTSHMWTVGKIRRSTQSNYVQRLSALVCIGTQVGVLDRMAYLGWKDWSGPLCISLDRGWHLGLPVLASKRGRRLGPRGSGLISTLMSSFPIEKSPGQLPSEDRRGLEGGLGAPSRFHR